MKTIVILGLPRTGSSLIANICKELGVNIGADLILGDKFNPKGIFENRVFVDLDREILGSRLWYDFPSQEEIMNKKRQFDKKIKEIIKSQEDVLWGWKCGLSLFTIDLYLPYLQDPHFIICCRNPSAFAKSMERQTGREYFKNALRYFVFYNQRLVDFICRHNYPMLFISYEEYFIEPEKQIKKIKEFIGVDKNINWGKIIDKNSKHF